MIQIQQVGNWYMDFQVERPPCALFISRFARLRGDEVKSDLIETVGKLQERMRPLALSKPRTAGYPCLRLLPRYACYLIGVELSGHSFVLLPPSHTLRHIATPHGSVVWLLPSLSWSSVILFLCLPKLIQHPPMRMPVPSRGATPPQSHPRSKVSC